MLGNTAPLHPYVAGTSEMMLGDCWTLNTALLHGMTQSCMWPCIAHYCTAKHNLTLCTQQTEHETTKPSLALPSPLGKNHHQQGKQGQLQAVQTAALEVMMPSAVHMLLLQA